MSINAPREVLQTQLATQNAASPVGNEILTGEGKNNRTSEAVRTSSAQADITDALEELGQAVATRGKQDLDKMKMRRGAGTDFEALGRIAEYYDKLPSMPSEESRRQTVQKFELFEELFERLEDGSGGGENLPTGEDIRKLLMEFDSEITHQFALLENIREDALQSGAPAAYLAVLDEVRQEMRAPDTAREILSGFAAAPQAVILADKIGSSPEEYRDSYRTLLRETPRMGRVFDELRKFNLSQNFDEVLDSFLKTAGDELSGFGAGADHGHLGNVVAELNTIKSLRTALDMASAQIEKLDRMQPPPAGSTRPDATELTSRLLNFCSAPTASVMDVEKLMGEYLQEPPEVGVAMINLLMDMHGNLPSNAVHSDNARLQQNTVLRAMSDQLVTREEAAYSG